MKPVEVRLREALEDRASQVTEDTLVRHHADPTRVVVPIGVRRDNRRNRVFALVAAAVAFILAGFSWLVIVNRQGVPATPLPTATSAVPSQSMQVPSTSATPSETPSAAASQTASSSKVPDTSHVAGKYQRSAVPWSVVGAGWSVVTHVDSVYSSTITLLLVSPWGASYSIGTFPNDELMDVSRNGRRVLLGTNSSLLVIDLESGTTALKKDFASMNPYLVTAKFIQPDGQAFVLLMAKSATDRHLDWFNGSNSSPSLSVSTDIQRLRASPDGRYLVGDRLTPSDSIVILDSKTGKKVATIPTPTGEYRCTTSNWWSDDEIVISCPTTGSTEQNVWRYSLSAKTTKRIGRPYNDVVAYPTPVGTVVAHSLNTCNGEPLGILNSDGNGNTPLATQPRMSGSGNLFTVVGTTAYLVYYNCATGNTFGQTFIAYNLTTHTTTTLVAGATNAAGPVWTLVVR